MHLIMEISQKLVLAPDVRDETVLVVIGHVQTIVYCTFRQVYQYVTYQLKYKFSTVWMYSMYIQSI